MKEIFTITADGLTLLGNGEPVDVLRLDNISPTGGTAAWDLGGGTATLVQYIGGSDTTDISNFATVGDVSLSTAPSIQRFFGGEVLGIYLTGATNPDMDVLAQSLHSYSTGS